MSKFWKTILASMGPEIIISFVIDWLASTIKNPDSEKAKRVLKIVRQLHRATEQFLTKFDAESFPWRGDQDTQS